MERSPSQSPQQSASPSASSAPPASPEPVPARAAVSYDERLSAPWHWWFYCLLLGLAAALVVYPFGVLPMLGGLAVGAAGSAMVVSSYGSARIRVAGGSLLAGDARIPVSALGEAEVLDPAEARAWRSHKADPRAFMLLRAYAPRALRIEVVDPQDPTPYLYLSTREPDRLAAAVEAARATAA
ncbi:DUF3093 domain-containing protein [Streptomyces sp. UH6]|uniref:DUF3093 domain-containing protein n=1 Tax=Streptomyces sp. UH6 TaxID=2748379 RepID=UPI0015D507E9|nr:DUF3093 domain-containing protein [Streptomyces sp. UH6]NYV75175.1 DUF3093 domain-containing protein [Streptomyces sp. UH6]